MEPVFTTGVVAALGGLLGVAICIIILLVAFLHAFKKDAMEVAERENERRIQATRKHTTGKRRNFKLEDGTVVYAFEDDLYVAQEFGPQVSSVELAPRSIWTRDGVIITPRVMTPPPLPPLAGHEVVGNELSPAPLPSDMPDFSSPALDAVTGGPSPYADMISAHTRK